MTLTVASFWVHRPEDYPKAADYPAMLRILQASCDRLQIRHVLLTDNTTADAGLVPSGIQHCATDLPRSLMQATTRAQAHFLENAPTWFGDILFVGADSILLADPQPHCPEEADLCVTARRPSPRLDAINNGFMYVRRRAVERVSALYKRVADRCGTEWRDDQRALVAELSPVPVDPGMHERAGLKVAFLPMARFNHAPLWPADPCKGAILLHFRGRMRKKLLFAWAKKRGFA